MDSQIPLPPEIWVRIPPEAQAYIRALESRVAALEATVQQLREQGQQTSRTSSRPPSSDPPQALGQRPRREPTGRRPGGQPGHAGQARALVPVEEVDVVVHGQTAGSRLPDIARAGDFGDARAAVPLRPDLRIEVVADYDI